MSDSLIITSNLFEDYINCPMKCFLRASQEKEAEDSYAKWFKRQETSYQHSEITRLANKFDQDDIITSPSIPKKLKNVSWSFAINCILRTQNLETSVPAVERQASKVPENHAQFIPIRFSFSNKINRTNKLLIAFDALVLSKITGIPVELGKIIYGENQSTCNVKTAEFKNEVKKIVSKISELLSCSSHPELNLNKYCTECEFQEQCYKIATEKDDLSLLSGLSDNEKRKLNNKGIFTVTQLSYTFRPRHRSRRLADKPEKYHYSLKALAIRENKIHIVGTPILKINGTPVFLDVESIPERSFYYLIGMQIKTAEGIIQHSLWANNEQEEKDIWIDFLKILSGIKNPVLIHYGSFEKTFIKKMSDRYPETLNKRRGINVLEPSINLLSNIYAKIYYPIYTNTLKDTAKYLNFSWSDPVSSGLKSIIWRYQWETTQDYMLKEKLICYNSEDCQALNIVLQNIIQITKQDLNNNQDIIHAHSLKMNNPQAKWSIFKSPIKGLEELNKAAYWDYQRERVYARKGGKQKRKQPIKYHSAKSLKYRVEKVFTWKVFQYCPQCKEMTIKKEKKYQRILEDLIFGKNSVKLRVIKYIFPEYFCPNCQQEYGVDQRYVGLSRYGWNLVAFCVFHMISLYISQMALKRILKRLYGFEIDTIGNIKEKASNYYAETKKSILKRIMRGSIIHVDENPSSCQGATYVCLGFNKYARSSILLYRKS